MEFIKGRSLPKTTTARAQSVQLGRVLPAGSLTTVRPPQATADESHSTVFMINKLFSLCTGPNALQKKKEIQKALHALIEDRISLSVFFSLVTENITSELPKNIKFYFEGNLKTIRETLLKKIHPPNIQHNSNTKDISVKTTKKVTTPKVVPVPKTKACETANSSLESTLVPPDIKPKNSRPSKCLTKSKPAKILKGNINDIKKNSGCLSEGPEHLLDSAILGGIKPEQECLIGTEHIGAQERSIKEKPFLNLSVLLARFKKKIEGVDLPRESMVLISQATEEYLKEFVEKLVNFVDLRMLNESQYSKNKDQSDMPAQLKFLRDVERAQERTRKNLKKEELLRIANSRSKKLDSQNAKIRARILEKQAAEAAEMRHREANLTALEAIAPRKKFNFSVDRPVVKTPRSNLRRANLRDAILILEDDHIYRRSTFLALLYLK